ncbi:MAG TPA: adenylyltransferase/cytidyltransferase family protein [Mycobacterium sp.]|nr:adenylyltransferase/cytidyltransferase family protein [Mycobacterium sp.]
MQRKAVLTIGTFDLFHWGHVRLLARCRMLAGKNGLVIVALNPDGFIEAYKHHPPVIPYHGRLSVLAACKYVDRVVCNVGGANSKPVIEAVMPDVIAVGDDWADKDYYGQLRVTPEWLAERHISIEYLPYTREISSSDIRAALR